MVEVLADAARYVAIVLLVLLLLGLRERVPDDGAAPFSMNRISWSEWSPQIRPDLGQLSEVLPVVSFEHRVQLVWKA
jgi:hypothetical protein